MAIPLPKYKQQVRVSGESVAQTIDPSATIKAAGADSELMAKIITDAGGIASDYFNKKAEAQDNATLIQLQNEQENLYLDIEQSKQDALLGKGDYKDNPISLNSEEYKNISKNKINDFKNLVNNAEFNFDDNRQKMEVSINSTINKINQREIIDFQKKELQQHNFELFNEAENNYVLGEIERRKLTGIDPNNYTDEEKLIKQKSDEYFEKSNLVYDSLSNTANIKDIQTSQQAAIKKSYLSEARFLNDSYLNKDLSYKDFSNQINILKNNLTEDIKNKKITGTSIQDITLELDAKIYNAAKVERNAIKTDLNNISNNLIDPEEPVDFSDVKFIYSKNPALGEYISNNLEISLAKSAISNESAKEAIDILNQVGKGEIEFEQALKNLKDKGDAGNIALFLAFDAADKSLENNDNFIAYTETKWLTDKKIKTDKQITIKVTPEFKDYFKTAKYFIFDKKSNVSKNAEKYLADYLKWTKTGKLYEQFKNDQFGALALDEARNIKSTVFDDPTEKQPNKNDTVNWADMDD